MTGGPEKRRGAKLQPVAVPFGCRPRLGARPIPFQTACERAEGAWDTTIAQSGALLPDLIAKMAGQGRVDAAELKGESLRDLTRSANDVRGIAQSLGSELTADIANAVFELAEAALPDGALPRSLISLLAQSSQQLVGYRRTDDGGQLHRHVQDLLAEVRLKIAGAAQSR